MVNTILQLLISGVALGFVYALVGIEYSIIWNATGLLNFAHSNVIALGAYIVAGLFFTIIGVPVPVALLAGSVVMGLVGCIMAICIFNPLRNMKTIYTVMGTILLGNIIYELIRIVYGPQPFTISGMMTGTFKVGNLVVSKSYVYIIAIAITIVAALQAFMQFTKAGKAMRCVSQNKKAAELMGINVKRNIMVTVAISAIICTIIGFMIIPLFSVSLSMSTTIGLKGFAAGVVGGFGYLPGCIVGGIVVGLIESISVLVVPSVYKDAVAYLVLIVFLLIKPSGLLGKKA